MSTYRVLVAGDTALVVEFGDRIDRHLNMQVLELARRLNEASMDGVVEIVPTFRSLMVHYDPQALSYATLSRCIDTLVDGLTRAGVEGRSWRLPVCYDACFAPDLESVGAQTCLSPAQVIERHSAETYHVYMLGFLPGQAYMGDLPSGLALPRRDSPRLRIPAGSLAIAMTMTCIFPLETPCGWHLIGRSPVPLWDRRPGSRKTLLAPGDKIKFVPVSLREYEDLAEKLTKGLIEIEPEGQTLEAVT